MRRPYLVYLGQYTQLESGTASAPIDLEVGENTINVWSVAADMSSYKIHTLTVTREENAASSDATLADLTLSSGTLSPAFEPGTTDYTATVAANVSSLTVTPTVNEANATIAVKGTTVASGAESGSIALTPGVNVINTVVTAQDGSTQQTYTVTVTRPVTAPTWVTPAAAGSHLDAVSLSATAAPGADWTGTFEVHGNSSYTALKKSITGTTAASGTPATATWTVDLNQGTYYLPPAYGTYNFALRARDAAGNTGLTPSGVDSIQATTRLRLPPDPPSPPPALPEEEAPPAEQPPETQPKVEQVEIPVDLGHATQVIARAVILARATSPARPESISPAGARWCRAGGQRRTLGCRCDRQGRGRRGYGRLP